MNPEPADLRKALAASPKAEAAWEDLTPISRRDYTMWINGAKQAETREKRIRRTCESIADGKRRPCCYSVIPMDMYKIVANIPKAKAQWGALSADEKRDLIEWVEAAEDRQARKARVLEASKLLEEGKRSA